MERDFVDGELEALARELPALDADALGVGERVLRLAGAMRRRLDAALAPSGVRSAGFGVLAALLRAGKPYELRPSDLSRATLLTSGAMTNRIDRLEHLGFVERRGQRGSDRRTVIIGLTDAGRRLVRATYSVYSDELRHLVQGMNRRETEMLTKSLREASIALGDLDVEF